MDTIKKVIKLNNGYELQLIYEPLFLRKEEIDLSRLIFIDYMNLSAEIATFGIVFAGIGFEVADLKKEVSIAELNLKIYKSTTKKNVREEYAAVKKRLNMDEVDDLTRITSEYKVRNIQHINAKHRLDSIESLYWSMRSKDEKLMKLAMSISTQDFKNDLMNTSVKEINYVKLRKFMPLLP